MGGDGPQPHPGSRPLTRPPHPCPEPRLGGSPGGSQPEVGRQRSIVKASQRLNHLMIQKSMGKGEGRAEGVASRRAAAAPPLSLPFPASTSDSAGGERTGVTPEPRRVFSTSDSAPGGRSHSGAGGSFSTSDSGGSAAPSAGGGGVGGGGEKKGKNGEKKGTCATPVRGPQHTPPPPPLPSPSPCV